AGRGRRRLRGRAVVSVLIGVLLFVVGLAIGAAVAWVLRRRQEVDARAEAERLYRARVEEAEREARRTVEMAQTSAQAEVEQARRRWEDDERRLRQRLEEDLTREREQGRAELQRARQDGERERAQLAEMREEVRRDREKLDQQEDRLNRRGEQQDARALRLDEVEERLNQRANDLQSREELLEASEARLTAQLHEIAQLTREQASAMVLERVERELEREKAVRVRAALDKADAEAKRRATDILAQAIQRSASEVSAAISVSVVPIPNDAMKGRIIGREGRNIRAFEALTGVDLIIDDTPEAVLLSSFNPIRREVAKMALSELVTDGRIHPARIEEVVQKAQHDMQNY